MDATRRRLIRIATLGLLCCLGACSGRAPRAGAQDRAPEENNPSAKRRQLMDIAPLRLKDEAFWTDGERIFDPVVRELRGQYFGLVLDAPRKVDVGARTTLPAFTYYMGTFQELATRSFQDQGLVVAVDPDSNQLYLSWAAHPEAFGEEPSEIEEEPGDVGELAEGDNVFINRLDLRSLLDLPWKPSRLLVNLVMLDMASNRVEVELVRGGASFQDPEVARFLADERAKANPPGIHPKPFPGARLPAYRQVPDAPPTPGGPGIELSVPRVAVLDSRRPVVLTGSFRLPAQPQDLVKPENRAYNEENGLVATEASPAPVAVATIHLLVTSSATDTPATLRLDVPVYGPLEDAGGGKRTLTGSFAVDLTRLLGGVAQPQTLFLYAFAGEAMTGPVPVGLVGPEDLPGR